MNNPRAVASCTRFGLCALSACAAATIAIAATSSAMAGAKVSGSPEAVSLQAQNSSIAEIFEALGHRFNIYYRSSIELQNHITGNYEGSLRHVMTRILEGYNFVVKTSPDQIEVIVLGKEIGPVKSLQPTVATSGPIREATPRVPITRQPDAVPAADHYVE
jgi:hypothetical protein